MLSLCSSVLSKMLLPIHCIILIKYFVYFIREVAHIQYQVFGCFSYAEVEVLTVLEVIVINKEQLFTIIALSGKRKSTGNEREREYMYIKY